MDIHVVTNQQILDRISRHCPRALHTYVICLVRSDYSGTLFLTKKQITDHLSESYTKFKNNLRLLAVEDLLEWQEIDGGIHITLALDDEFTDTE